MPDKSDRIYAIYTMLSDRLRVHQADLARQIEAPDWRKALITITKMGEIASVLDMIVQLEKE